MEPVKEALAVCRSFLHGVEIFLDPNFARQAGSYLSSFLHFLWKFFVCGMKSKQWFRHENISEQHYKIIWCKANTKPVHYLIPKPPTSFGFSKSEMTVLQSTVRANQEHIEVLRKPVKVARIYVQLLRKVRQVKSKFEKKLLNFLF